MYGSETSLASVSAGAVTESIGAVYNANPLVVPNAEKCALPQLEPCRSEVPLAATTL